MTKRKTPFFFTFKGLSNSPIFNTSIFHFIGTLTNIPFNTNGLSQTSVKRLSKEDFLKETISLIKKPLSDITASPCSREFGSPNCFTISLPLIDPAAHRRGTNTSWSYTNQQLGSVPVFVTTPCGLLTGMDFWLLNKQFEGSQ